MVVASPQKINADIDIGRYASNRAARNIRNL
jgi:hypothetical protein